MTRSARGTVLAQGMETRYFLTGSGPLIVLLASPSESERLAEALAPRFRVLVPVLPAFSQEEPDVNAGCCWLGSVLDGLGVTKAVLLGPARLQAIMNALREEDPARITGVLIARDA